MKQKEVTINGKTYPVVFTLKTITGFEEIVEHSFFNDDFTKMSSRMAIVVAAITAADINADISAEDMLEADKWKKVKEVIEAYNVIMELSSEFFDIPLAKKKIEAADEKEKEGEQKKN